MNARQEVLRHLGYGGQGIDTDMSARIDSAIDECAAVSSPRFVYKLFELSHRENGIYLGDTGIILSGELAASRLRSSFYAAVLAATLGSEIETRIRMEQYRDMSYALMLDAAADWLIEDVCDKACAELDAASKGLDFFHNDKVQSVYPESAPGKCVGTSHLSRREGSYERSLLFPGPRFSPGYGDLSLALQPDLLRLVDAPRRVGLSCTASFALTPRKSVTAIIPFASRDCGSRDFGCRTCDMRAKCEYSRPFTSSS